MDAVVGGHDAVETHRFALDGVVGLDAGQMGALGRPLEKLLKYLQCHIGLLLR